MIKGEEGVLKECHVLMSDAIKAYEDKGLMSYKLFEIRQFCNRLSEGSYKKIEVFVNENIRPMVYDADYFSFLKQEQYGAFDENNHFIISGDHALEKVIFRKYFHVQELLEKLNDFMTNELNVVYKR